MNGTGGEGGVSDSRSRQPRVAWGRDAVEVPFTSTRTERASTLAILANLCGNCDPCGSSRARLGGPFTGTQTCAPIHLEQWLPG